MEIVSSLAVHPTTVSLNDLPISMPCITQLSAKARKASLVEIAKYL
jgi:hypothetical protein